MHSEITSKRDKLTIYYQADIKYLHGLWNILILRKSREILLVGKNIQITQVNHIRCGTFFKYEDFSKIHALSKNGIIWETM